VAQVTQPEAAGPLAAATGCSPRPPAAARSGRPTLTHVLDQLRPGDTLVVWKLDRLGRSLRHLVDTVTGLAERGVGFRSLQEAIATTRRRIQAVVDRRFNRRRYNAARTIEAFWPSRKDQSSQPHTA
jgi:Resolvase, N terminal domain